ncbi:hypothetical protein K469DRAFT_746008 [Zopfia rhizophila CBS 207.26]|uniref:Uncharacterized protein n=1 Tax=Zopfia rhizophila CBS 207.26 TaxID=1314779 RepID=A0A6A6EM35_9PEZI|nr:hypothetical protein K469DRAFT_746008 [Zopfia rhizophila CBS 207.26]
MAPEDDLEEADECAESCLDRLISPKHPMNTEAFQRASHEPEITEEKEEQQPSIPTGSRSSASEWVYKPYTSMASNLPLAHPLSLLLTCRKINQEATLLAFSTHPFTIPKLTTFFDLKLSSMHLQPEQFQSITALAFDTGINVPLYSYRAADFLTNSLALFPGVKRLEIRVKREHIEWNSTSQPVIRLPGLGEVVQESIRNGVPEWWHTAIANVLHGRSLAWQHGQRWKAEWPQLGEDFRDPEYLYGKARMDDPSYLDTELIQGTSSCGCGCGEFSSLRAFLVQETGRKVEIEAVYYDDREGEWRRSSKRLRVRLREGVERLPVREVDGGNGLQWDADEEYWKGMRKGCLKGWLDSWFPFKKSV